MIDRSVLRGYAERTQSAVWETDLATLPAWQALPLRALRVTLAVLRDLHRGELQLRAMSLVYTTLLSLVPLVAISFAMLKAFGAHNQVEPTLLNLLAPLGDKAAEITNQIIAFVDRMKVGVLGTLGVALLFYTVVSLVQKIERAFNHVWRVQHERGFAQRLRDYLSVLVVGPVLIFVAVGISATVVAHPLVNELSAVPLLGELIQLAGRLVPYVMIASAFTFMYLFLPNTKVKIGSALAGGFSAGALWLVAGWIFAGFVVGSTKYTAIYSTFATLIFFMIWLYVGWLILLTGASVAFYVQQPEYARGGGGPLRLSHQARELLALGIAALIARRFQEGAAPMGTAELAHRVGMAQGLVEDVLTALSRAGLLCQTADEVPAWLPARATDAVPLRDVLRAVRRDGTGLPASAAMLPQLAGYEDTVDGAFGATTLKDLALSEQDGAARRAAE